MNLLKKLPIPIAGLALGLAALGNLVKDGTFGFLRPFFGILSVLIVILLALKLLLLSKKCLEALDNPVVLGTFATFPMAITILSSYLPKDSTIAKIVWIFGIVFHALLIIYFTSKFVLNFDIKKVFTTWFIMFVGIIAGSVTAPNVGMKNIGQILFWFGFVAYIILLALVLYRLYVVKNIPEPALPTFTVLAAPAALSLAGYLSSFDTKNKTIVMFLFVLTAVFYVFGLYYFTKYAPLKFMPSFSAFTFPLVISGIACKMVNVYFTKIKSPISFMPKVIFFMTLVALFSVSYVCVKYTEFLLKKEDAK